MAYEAYATAADYAALFPGEEITEAALRAASRHIDSLTFNRIVAAGFANLMEFQQEVIREVVCRQAKFETENADLLDSAAFGSYSINGVSMNLGGDGSGLYTSGGVTMPRELYGLLQQTGLCVRVLGWCL